MRPVLAFFGIGPFELLLLAALAVMLYGGDLPDMARKAGRLLARLRAISADLSRELHRPPPPGLERPPGLSLTPEERDRLRPPAPPWMSGGGSTAAAPSKTPGAAAAHSAPPTDPAPRPADPPAGA